MSLTEHVKRNPTYEKGQGRPLPARGNPLTDLTTVKLNRKGCPKTSGRTCVESMLCKVHRELYIPPPPRPNPQTMHLTCTISWGWMYCADLKWSSQGWLSVGQIGSGMAVVVWSDGPILVVWCGSWCMALSVVGSETTPIVWCGGLIWDGYYCLLSWSDSMA